MYEMARFLGIRRQQGGRMSWKERFATWAICAAMFAAFVLMLKVKTDAERQQKFDEIVASLCDNPVCDCELPCQCDHCECGLVPVEPEPQKQEPAKPKPVVWLHTIDNCPPCNVEKGRAFAWANWAQQQGWEFAIFDDTPGDRGKLYPWYEVRDSEGFEFSVIGQLTPQTILQQRDRAKNAASSSR